VFLALQFPWTDARVNQSARTVWQVSSVFGGGGVGEDLRLDPGQSVVRTVTWDQTDLMGAAVPSGDYGVTAWIVPGILNGIQLSMDETRQFFAPPPVLITIG